VSIGARDGMVTAHQERKECREFSRRCSCNAQCPECPWTQLGYVEVYSIQYRHTLYEVKVRDAEGLRVELFVHPSAGKLLRNRGGELTSKNFE
jgi:hypothetical protein